MTAFHRRAFGRLTAEVAGMSAVAFGAPTVARARFHLNIGVGTFSYHTLSREDMLVQLKNNQVQKIEMLRGEFMLMRPPR